LPDETKADLDETIDLVREIRSVSQEYAKEYGYIPEIIVDINPLVPKPLTDFAGVPIEDAGILKKKVIYLKKKLRNFGRVFVYGESPKNAQLQYRLANHLIPIEEIIRSAL
jgi:hypothetical protein